MNKFQIENLDFCQSTRSGKASIITGGKIEVDKVNIELDLKVDTLVKVQKNAGLAAGGAAGAAAGSIGKKPHVFASVKLFGEID